LETIIHDFRSPEFKSPEIVRRIKGLKYDPKFSDIDEEYLEIARDHMQRLKVLHRIINNEDADPLLRHLMKYERKDILRWFHIDDEAKIWNGEWKRNFFHELDKVEA
jgi:hypothetical protein